MVNFPAAQQKPLEVGHLVRIRVGKYAGRLGRVTAIGTSSPPGAATVRLNGADLRDQRIYEAAELDNLGEFGGAQ